MRITKQAKRDAKRLLQSCKVGGLLDEIRVRKTVSAIIAQKPRGYFAVLIHFQRLVRLELESCTARVESVISLAPNAQAGLQIGLTQRYGAGLRFEFIQNPGLLGGLRVKVGSDVYDGTLRARLAALEENLTG